MWMWTQMKQKSLWYLQDWAEIYKVSLCDMLYVCCTIRCGSDWCSTSLFDLACTPLVEVLTVWFVCVCVCVRLFVASWLDGDVSAVANETPVCTQAVGPHWEVMWLGVTLYIVVWAELHRTHGFIFTREEAFYFKTSCYPHDCQATTYIIIR